MILLGELIVAAAGVWQLCTWAELGVRWACALVRRRIALHQLRALTDAAMRAPAAPPDPLPQPIRIVTVPAREYAIEFWNGCVLPVDRSTESGRLILLSGLLLRFHWHSRPRA